MNTPVAPAIEVVDIAKAFGHVQALRGVSITVQPGSVTALVGDNGAGKSTLIKCLSGLVSADDGQIRIHGQDVHISTPTDARRYGLETVYQDLALCNQLTVWQNLFLGRELVHTVGPLRFLNRSEMKRHAQEAINDMRVQLPDVNQRVKRLSGGQRQAIAIGRAMLWGSGIIILDEPTAALGTQETAQIEAMIREIVGRGNTVLLISHDFSQVARLASRVWVMRGGRVVGEVADSDVTPEKILSTLTTRVA